MTKSFRALQILVLSFGLLFFGEAIAHKGEVHKEKPKAPPVEENKSLQQINEMYLKDIKPIFQRSCFDCHSSQSVFPWYYKIPGARQLIEKDIAEAKEHLNMEKDFPFESHATPEEDLNSILESVEKNEMPPFRYRILHSSAKLSDEDKKKVKDWVENGKVLLSQ